MSKKYGIYNAIYLAVSPQFEMTHLLVVKWIFKFFVKHLRTCVCATIAVLTAYPKFASFCLGIEAVAIDAWYVIFVLNAREWIFHLFHYRLNYDNIFAFPSK